MFSPRFPILAPVMAFAIHSPPSCPSLSLPCSRGAKATRLSPSKAALELLGVLPVKGNIFSGDAIFCQRDFCAGIIDGGGDYVFTAKDNQPSLVIDIKAGLAYQEQAQRLTAALSP
jgi:hypothetical protein